MTTPYMKSMFHAQGIVEMLTKDDGANVRIIANALRQYIRHDNQRTEEWPGFSRCANCGDVEVAHPLKRCVNFIK